MATLNSLRQAIGISSTGFKLIPADYREMLIFSTARDYEEFKQACDNIKCEYPTMTVFNQIVAAAESDDEEGAEGAAPAVSTREYMETQYPGFTAQSDARRATGRKRLANYKKPPTPDEIRAARGDISQTAAAELIGKPLRTWQNWEAPVDSQANRAMDSALFELFTLKIATLPK